MKLVSAYLLARLGGNENPDKAAISKILDSVGIAVGDDAELDKIIAGLNGKDINEVIAEGSKKFAALPAAGAAAAPAAGGAAPAAAAAAAPKAAAAPAPAAKEESDEEMGFGLFD
eukprot:CAMPEP_0177628856 /NCGR_PEP_ID=MMETSP0447-20121125/355_1 /TAXON_ID=0 /ORGANISM="Stygamoeba regulata, Strain BSH-02190019" /LENGTH=114 /DNA_ID=CAMNT_0019130133 /DNA_START=140 /DNA_END=484 /DNA_ORIENTATION=+